jgi:hypothetical protein
VETGGGGVDAGGVGVGAGDRLQDGGVNERKFAFLRPAH